MSSAFRSLGLGWLILLLVACGQPEPTVTSVVLPPGWQTVDQAGFSFALPPEWQVLSADDGNFAGAMDELVRENPGLQAVANQARTAVTSGQIKLIAFDLAPEDLLENFTANLSIGQLTLEQPVPLSQIAEANERELQSNGFTNIQRTSMQVGGEDAARLSSTLEIKDAAGEALVLAVEQVILVRPQQQYVVTFTTTSTQRTRMRPLFEQIMTTFRVE